MNVVTGNTGEAGAVLIRGLKLKDKILDGPGKVCRHLGITKVHNGLDLINNDKAHLIEGINISTPIITSRIGITKARDKLWRFYTNDYIKVQESINYAPNLIECSFTVLIMILLNILLC